MASKPSSTQPKITDVLGVDFGSTSTKLVRIRTLAGKISLVDADVMPAFELEGESASSKLNIPKKLSAPYVAAALTGQESHVRFMFISSKLNDGRAIQQRVAKSLSLSREYRVGYTIVEKAKMNLITKYSWREFRLRKYKQFATCLPPTIRVWYQWRSPACRP